MQRLTDALGGLIAAAAVVLLLVYAYVWRVADSDFSRTYDVPLVEVPVSEDPEVIAEGRRQAEIHGCFWCHGDKLQGRPYFVMATRGVKAVAPNLTWKARDYSAAELARAIRHGVRADGTSVQPAMPAFTYFHMSDEEVGALVSFIRSMPVVDGHPGEFRLWPVGKVRWTMGELPRPAAELIDHDAPRVSSEFAEGSVEHGRYLAESICTECHSDNGRLRVPGAPHLGIAKAYSKEQFVRLMRTGVPLGEREIDYHMVEVSEYRYGPFMTEAEVDALYEYFIKGM